MHDWKVSVQEKKRLIDGALDELIPLVFPEELYRAARYLIEAGGKRLRPIVVLLSARALQPNIEIEQILPAAAAVELVHNFTLVHDDIMDADETRRSIETVHTKWGLSEGILAGDALYAKAFEILSYTLAKPENVTKCLRILSKACLHVCEGQWLDITFENDRRISEAQYLEMVQKKTASLYAAALAMGGILADGIEDEIQAMWEFGLAMGIAFQIRDDVLDLITPYDVLGKDRGSDLVEGKMTLIMIHGLRHGVKLNLSELTAEREIDEAVKTLEDAGSIAYAMEKAHEILDSGKSKIASLTDSEAKEELLKLAEYMISRTY
ncbi:MAG: polyprenyl synthetase family protein [Euryarchaeota archaeon]|nr:polyprenyl synthetase family protein [Euryarchaeota archaeon]